jgi:hypothetical protein
MAWFSIWQNNVALCSKEKPNLEIIDAISTFRTSGFTRQQAPSSAGWSRRWPARARKAGSADAFADRTELAVIRIRAAEDADRNSGTWLGAG